MKDFSQKVLEEDIPHDWDAEETINFCLKQLHRDEKHNTDEEIVHSLTFEELIGALLVARNVIQEYDRCKEKLNESCLEQ